MKFFLFLFSLILLTLACKPKVSETKQVSISAKPMVVDSFVCPYCGKSDSVLPIIYADPTPMALIRQAYENKIVIGGCVTNPGYMETHFCQRDKKGFKNKFIKEYQFESAR